MGSLKLFPKLKTIETEQKLLVLKTRCPPREPQMLKSHFCSVEKPVVGGGGREEMSTGEEEGGRKDVLREGVGMLSCLSR